MTAGIRLYFMKAVLLTDYMDSVLLDAAQTACRRSTTELRMQKDKGKGDRTFADQRSLSNQCREGCANAKAAK